MDEAILYIGNDSPDIAEKVKRDILLKINALLEHPEGHAPDKYKKNNDSSFRAFEIGRYRISHRYTGKEIRIIPIRHTKMNPLKY